MEKVMERWHAVMESQSTEGLWDLLAPDCVFWSPVVHTPQQGREITFKYLSAASHVFGNDFRYAREVIGNNLAVLEFECLIDDIKINGVDMIEVEGGRIVDFKVMVRPLKAVNKVHERMMAMLEALGDRAS
ncbi:MAG: nuclear transport factor 2 family protein [Gammaproteobacteria bacterium]|jgi:hypothetical protein|nr:nuclear transport factor 2 family protein [Gammaproteobacteria bacterium]